MKNSYNIDAFLFLLENFVFILNGHVFQFFVGKEKPEMKKKKEKENWNKKGKQNSLDSQGKDLKTKSKQGV